MSFEDFAFDDVKPRKTLPEGEYLMEVVSWELVSPKNENPDPDKRGKNLRVSFKLVDPMQKDARGEESDFSDFKTNTQIYVMFSNPFSVTSLLAALLNLDPEAEDIGKQIAASGRSLAEKSDWIGEKVGVRLWNEPVRDNPHKFYLKPVEGAYFSATTRF